VRDSYRRSDFERMERGRYARGACPKCASTRVFFRMQPRWIPVWPKHLFKGYRLGWSCDFCGHVWFDKAEAQ